VDPTLRRIIDRACALKPEDRYHHASDFADDLNRWLNDEPILWQYPPKLRLLAHWVRTHQATALATAAAMVLLVSTAAFGSWGFATSQYADEQAILATKNAALADEQTALAMENAALAVERDAIQQALLQAMDTAVLMVEEDLDDAGFNADAMNTFYGLERIIQSAAEVVPESNFDEDFRALRTREIIEALWLIYNVNELGGTEALKEIHSILLNLDAERSP
jgi:hypothetical protein